MKVLIIGGAGMIGRKLAERLARDGELGGKAISSLTLYDVVARHAAGGAKMPVKIATGDLPAAGEADKLIADRPDIIFHLAAIVSGEAEQDFDKGYRINMDGTRAPAGGGARGRAYKPRLVFASSIAVFGAPFPEAIGDEFFNTPLTSYGTQKTICELLISDYTARACSTASAFACPPSACGPASPTRRPPASSPTSCASRWPARRRCCPFPRASCIGTPRPRAAVGFMIHAASIDTGKVGAPARADHAGRVRDGGRADRRACRRSRATRWRPASAANPMPSSKASWPAGRAISRPSAPWRWASRPTPASRRSSASTSRTSWAAASPDASPGTPRSGSV